MRALLIPISTLFYAYRRIHSLTLHALKFEGVKLIEDVDSEVDEEGTTLPDF